MQFKPSNPRQIRGQGMTEYIIIVALIAVAAIGVYNLFGKTVRNQTAGIAAALGGDATKATSANEAGKTAGGKAAEEANNQKSLGDFTTAAGAR